jgi:PAS domain S-box-containing protein
LPDAIAILDGAGRYIEQNHAHMVLFGFPDRELLGQTPLFHMEPDLFSRIAGELQKAGLYRGEILSRTKGAQTLSVELTAFVLTSSTGEPTRWVWISRDVTKHRRLGEALRVSSLVVEASPFPIAVVDSQYRYRYANPMFRRMQGLAEGEIAGKSVADIWGRETFHRTIKPPLDRCLLGEESAYEGWFELPDGGRKFMVTTCTALRSPDGTVDGAAVIARDVTGLKLAAEAQHRLAEQSRAHQTTLMALARDEAIQNGYLGEAFRAMTLSTGRSLGVARTSIWLFSEDRRILEGKDLYELDADRHTAGLRLVVHDRASYVQALEAAEHVLSVREPNTDPRTRELLARYLSGAGVTALLHVPIRVKGRLLGVLCLEQAGPPRDWSVEDEHFAGSVATLVTLALEARQLRQSEARFRCLFEEAPLGMCMYGEPDRIIRVNRAFCALLGYDEEELLGNTIQLCAHPEELARNVALVELLGHGERTHDVLDTRYLRKDGTIVWVTVSARKLTTPGTSQPAVLTTIQDMTTQKGAEEMLRRNNEALEQRVLERTADLDRLNQQLQERVGETRRAEQAARASEERFRQLADNIQDVFWMKDLITQQVIYVSPAYEKIWGRTCESLYEASQDWLRGVHPLDRARVRKAAQAKQVTGEYDEKFRIVRPDGTVRWVRDRAFPIQDSSGTVVRVAGLAEDITEYQQLEQQVRQAAKMEALGRLAGGVAHDFNNLLTVIRGYCSFLLQSIPDSDARHAQLVEIRKAADRGAGLTQQLLLFSRGQAVQPKVVDLNIVLERMLEMVQRLVGEDVQITTTLGAQLWPVKLDMGQLEQVIVNLAVNARDAMPQGGHLYIETMNVPGEPDKPASMVRLIVRDTGCGMDETTKAQVFEPFFTTKKPGKGTGLGLATVHGIITKSDGTIQVQSAPGQGSTFIIEFPRHEVQPPAEREVRRPQTPSGSETILLVEDAATVRQLLREVLRSAGYYLLEASDGVEALEQSRQHQGPIHLVITDAVMPRMGGRQLMDEVRLARPDIQFLLMSGYMNERAGRQGNVQIDVPFIQKPFLPSDLLRTVRQVLDRSGESKLSPNRL